MARIAHLANMVRQFTCVWGCGSRTSWGQTPMNARPGQRDLTCSNT